LLLVISSSISHDLLKKTFKPNITEKQELLYARCAAAVAIVIAGLFGIYPPGFVAQVVAFAFGLAAATIFPALFLGIFSKSINKEGAILGMLAGLIFTSTYIIYFKFLNPAFDNASYWIYSISPEGIGFVGMLVNFLVAITTSMFYPKPPSNVIQIVEAIRLP
jgi:cation/acetate symporter